MNKTQLTIIVVKKSLVWCALGHQGDSLYLESGILNSKKKNNRIKGDTRRPRRLHCYQPKIIWQDKMTKSKSLS